MKKIGSIFLALSITFLPSAFAQVGEKTIDSELILVSPGMVVDWHFEDKALLDGL